MKQDKIQNRCQKNSHSCVPLSKSLTDTDNHKSCRQNPDDIQQSICTVQDHSCQDRVVNTKASRQAEAMATDQPDTTSMVRTSMSYRSTALQVNKNRLMYRALYQQICSSDQLLHTSTNIAKNLTQREKRLKEKNAKCPISKFNRICLKERIHREKKD